MTELGWGRDTKVTREENREGLEGLLGPRKRFGFILGRRDPGWSFSKRRRYLYLSFVGSGLEWAGVEVRGPGREGALL